MRACMRSGRWRRLRRIPTIPVANWQKALNDILPVAIRVKDVSEASGGISRAEVGARENLPLSDVSRRGVSAVLARYVWHYPFPLDEAAMIEAACAVVGSMISLHSRLSMRRKTKGSNHEGHEVTRSDSAGENVREIFVSSWVREADEFIYTVRGSGFLHHMVRNLVGTFLLVGKGTLAVSAVKKILDARDRSAAGATAPAAGLYLVSVEY